MIIELKVLPQIKSHSSLSMDSWYYDDMYVAGVLILYDDLSQAMKDYIFDKGNIRECVITHGSVLCGKCVKYILKPTVLARYETHDDSNFDDGQILYNSDDIKNIKELLIENEIFTFCGVESLDQYMFFEVTKRE